MPPNRRKPGPWQRELDDFVRALSGAFLFGTPLLFTMEMWSLGTQASTSRLVILLVVAFLANLSLSSMIGFKRGHSFGSSLEQTFDAVAVGITSSLIVLLVLNRISPDHPFESILGMVIAQTLPLSIGASVANAIFAPGKGREGSDTEPRSPGPWRATLSDLGATAVGAIFIGANVAPTEEIPMLAGALTSGHQLALIMVTLAITYGIVFASGFDPAQRQPRSTGIFRGPLSETAMAYVVSLLVALGALVLFNQVDGADPLASVVAQTLVLGLPSAIGGAAGRLVL